MEFVAREVVLRDQARVLLRRVTGADAAAVRAHRVAEQPSMPYVLTLPEELPTLEVQARQLDELEPGATGVLVGVFAGAEVVGLGGMMRGKKKKIEHVWVFGLSLAERWRGRGLGRALTVALLDWARAHPLIEKVELEVLPVNTVAVELYRELGFVSEGVLSRHIRQPDGAYLDSMCMGLWVGAK